MDRGKFLDPAGELVEISTPRRDFAFVPTPLPPDWDFNPDLWPLLVQAKEELARLDGIARTLPNPELLLKPLQSREALRSSSLEGTYATPQELLLFEIEPREPSSESDPLNSQLEVSNYSRSLRTGLSLLNELPFCLRLIRELHKTLLAGVRGRDKAPGDFRRSQNHIGSDYRFIPPPPNHLTACLGELDKAMNAETTYDPLVYCYMLHYQFETIHPFLDGNGRVGRALLALMIHRKCELYMPWLYMSAYYERYKDEYINNLFRVSAESDWSKWIEFCLRGTVVQASDSIRRIEELMALKDRYHRTVAGSGNRLHPIVDMLFASPLLTVPMVQSEFTVSYPTAKSDIEKLKALNILRDIENTYPQFFFSPEIFSIAYIDD